MMGKIRAPFLIVNPKSYLYGEESLKLAKAADLAAKETGVEILFTCPFADLRYIKENTTHVKVTAQHMDALRPGRGMGHVLPESLKAAGAEAVFLNHAENPLTLCELAECIKRAKELDIATVVCADSVAEGVAIAELTPDILLCEPTDLIGTGHVAGDDYVIQATTRIREVNENIMVMIASGVSTAEDVYNVIKLGADGTGATSGIIKAPDPGLMVMEMAKAIVQAVKDREQGERQ